MHSKEVTLAEVVNNREEWEKIRKRLAFSKSMYDTKKRDKLWDVLDRDRSGALTFVEVETATMKELQLEKVLTRRQMTPILVRAFNAAKQMRIEEYNSRCESRAVSAASRSAATTPRAADGRRISNVPPFAPNMAGGNGINGIGGSLGNLRNHHNHAHNNNGHQNHMTAEDFPTSSEAASRQFLMASGQLRSAAAAGNDGAGSAGAGASASNNSTSNSVAPLVVPAIVSNSSNVTPTNPSAAVPSLGGGGARRVSFMQEDNPFAANAANNETNGVAAVGGGGQDDPIGVGAITINRSNRLSISSNTLMLEGQRSGSPLGPASGANSPKHRRAANPNTAAAAADGAADGLVSLASAIEPTQVFTPAAPSQPNSPLAAAAAKGSGPSSSISPAAAVADDSVAEGPFGASAFAASESRAAAGTANPLSPPSPHHGGWGPSASADSPTNANRNPLRRPSEQQRNHHQIIAMPPSPAASRRPSQQPASPAPSSGAAAAGRVGGGGGATSAMRMSPGPSVTASGLSRAQREKFNQLQRAEFRLFLMYIADYMELYFVFETIDASGDGKVSLEEFLLAAPTLAGWGLFEDGMSPESAFAALDVSGDGTLTFKEFSDWAITKHLQLSK